MANTEQPDDTIDWGLTTWDGARREALRRWAELPPERIIATLEEMQELNGMLASPSVNSTPTSQQVTGDSYKVHEQHAEYTGAADSSPPSCDDTTATERQELDQPDKRNKPALGDQG